MGITLAIITIAMHINVITMTIKLLMVAMACLSIFVSIGTALPNLLHINYARLGQDVRSGRSDLADIDRLRTYTAQRFHDELICNFQLRKTKAILALYVSDLYARGEGVKRLDETGDLSVQISRANAMAHVRNVLVCSPLDGEMWYYLSMLSFLLKMDRAKTDAYLSWSERTTPQERWIKSERDAFALRYLSADNPEPILR